MRRLGRRGIGVVAIVTALVLALGVESAVDRSAFAAPGAPTWDEVEEARGDVEATEIAISRIVDAVRALDVVPRQVVQSADRWDLADGRV